MDNYEYKQSLSILKKLKPNWNSYDAPAPSKKVINLLTDYLTNYFLLNFSKSNITHLYATPRGGCYVVIELDPNPNLNIELLFEFNDNSIFEQRCFSSPTNKLFYTDMNNHIIRDMTAKDLHILFNIFNINLKLTGLTN